MVDLAGNIVVSANGATFTPRTTSIIKDEVETSITATALDDGVNVVEHNGYQYIVHPAFETNLDLGGWSSDLPGIWCAKFETSREDSLLGLVWANTINIGNTLTKNAGNNNNIRAVSKPDNPSWREINIANCYTNAYYYDRSKESHLMKNSEWGAVAYLTHSKFGRNRDEVRINNNSLKKTGNAAKTPNAGGSLITIEYNDAGGELASSTGNIYGIYDLSGGSWENVAAFNKNYSGNCFTGDSYIDDNKNHFASSSGVSTQYATAYSGTSNIQGIDIFSVGIVGDSIKEVFYKIESQEVYNNWFNDNSLLLNSANPFFVRGGAYNNGENAGIFASTKADGSASDKSSYRIVLAFY